MSKFLLLLSLCIFAISGCGTTSNNGPTTDVQEVTPGKQRVTEPPQKSKQNSSVQERNL